jgi:polar amino acid transport system substrate-binding protein
MMRLAHLGILLAAVFAATSAHAAGTNAPAELAPTGVLRVAVGVGPAPSGFYATEPRPGELSGVTVELARFLGYKLGVPVRFVRYAGSGEIQQAANSAAWDLTFMPVDDERRQAVDFGSAYHLLQSSYLVAPGSNIASIAEANRRGVRIVGVRDTATFRASSRASPMATHIPVDGPERAIAMMMAGQADAIALGRESLNGIRGRLPGSRILDGSFLNSSTAIALPKGRPAALAAASALVEEAKASGVVRNAFDSVGLRSSVVAPLGMIP